MDERQFGGQRKDSRLTVNKEFDSIERFILEYVSDISSSGAFIVTQDPLPVGTKVNMKFSIVSDGIKTIEGEGEVVRIVKPGSLEKAGMGVVFTSLTSCSKEMLSMLITKVPKKKPVILG